MKLRLFCRGFLFFKATKHKFSALNLRKKIQKNKTIELPLQIIELEQDNYHILIEGIFPDQNKLFWVIDTGASKTVFDKTQDQYYRLVESDDLNDYQSAGINQGMLETSVGKLTSVNFGTLEIKDQKVALIDLSHVNEIYEKYTSVKIAGLLGGDILMQFRCKIDYAKKTIAFTTN